MSQKLEFWLHINGPEGPLPDFQVPLGKSIIGRDPGCALPLVFPLISRRHAELNCTDTICEIVDLGSANGTQLNHTRLEPDVPQALENEARIEIGPFEFVVEVIIHELAEETPPAEPLEPAAEPQPVQPVVEQGAADSAPEPAPVSPKAEAAAKEKAPAKKTARRAADQPVGVDQPPAPPLPPAEPFAAPLPEPGRDLPGLSRNSRQLLEYLPGIYQTDFMSRFLGLFESILIPIEWNVDNFDLFLDPGTAPRDFLPWLAGWFEIIFDSSWSEEQRRLLLKQARLIYARQGTRWALQRVLEIYTGKTPEIVEFMDSREPFTFLVKIPVRADDYKRDLIERIIDASKPAHTFYKIELQG